MNTPKMLSIAALLMATTTSAPAAYGVCFSPHPPSAFLTKPMKPTCFNGCDDWQISAYRNDVDRYYGQLRSYLADVDTYYEDAYKYAKCMADLD